MATATGEIVRPPEASIGAVEERELPPAPPLRRILGPGIVLVGVGIASGEYILYPYIASQVGLMCLWAAFVGLLTQFFINMEVERYTLATGETAVTGFQRLWKPCSAARSCSPASTSRSRSSCCRPRSPAS